jgi:hypothetical protein
MNFFDNVPFDPRKKDDIEQKTEAFLEKASPDFLRRPMPLDVNKFLTHDLLKYYNIGFEIVENEKMESTIEGMYDPFSNKIVFSEKGYDLLLKGHVRSRFTGTHEGYHGIDHGDQIRAMKPTVLLNNLYLYRQKRVRDIPIYQQAEWQANYGAGAFLMPKRTLGMIIHDMGESRYELFDVVAEVASIFKVSEQAAKIRIDKIKRFYM